MKVILGLVLITAITATTLKNILKSPKETLELFNRFKKAKHLHYQPEEARWRLKLFKESAERVADLNSDVNEEAEYELNKFSVMTDDEMSRYLGYNGSLPDSEDAPATPTRLMKRSVPGSKMWVYEGLVTPAINQESCGSCWAFAAIVAIEGRYKQETGILRKFSEQELLDCTMEGNLVWVTDGKRRWKMYADGCNGGWYHYSFAHIKKKGRLASAKDYPYHGNDCTCEGPVIRNSLIAAKITGYVNVQKSEDYVIEALSQHVLAVAFMATKKFSSYKRGLFKDPKCHNYYYANHAVAAVGYTPDYVLVKNSWGDDWGDHGFVRFKRNHQHCFFWNYAKYPVMTQTDVVDVLGADEKTDYDPVFTDPHPDCDQYVDTRTDCDVTECADQVDEGINWVECKRTCNHCTRITDYTGECPAGTKMCNGACTHEHFC